MFQQLVKLIQVGVSRWQEITLITAGAFLGLGCIHPRSDREVDSGSGPLSRKVRWSRIIGPLLLLVYIIQYLQGKQVYKRDFTAGLLVIALLGAPAVAAFFFLAFTLPP